MYQNVYIENTILKTVKLFVFRKTIPLTLIDEDSYEKDVLFYAQLGEIRMIGGE